MSSDNLETQKELQALYKLCANGNEEAFKFVIAWQHYCHNIDDDVDGEPHMKLQENKVSNYVTAFALYNSNYWLKHNNMLFILIPLISVDYLTSNMNEVNEYSRDFLRSTGNNMLKAVAYIEGGWELLCKVAPIIANLSFKEHHKVIEGV